jgi:hypothetical protein
MAAYQEKTPLPIEAGATFRKTYKYVSSLSPVVPIDITGYTARMQFRAKIGDALPVLSLTDVANASGQLIINGPQGSVEIYINDTTTSALYGGGVFDLELVSPTGEVIRLVQGSYSVSPNVTR